jgi:hypothetical protein
MIGPEAVCFRAFCLFAFAKGIWNETGTALVKAVDMGIGSPLPDETNWLGLSYRFHTGFLWPRQTRYKKQKIV